MLEESILASQTDLHCCFCGNAISFSCIFNSQTKILCKDCVAEIRRTDRFLRGGVGWDDLGIYKDFSAAFACPICGTIGKHLQDETRYCPECNNIAIAIRLFLQDKPFTGNPSLVAWAKYKPLEFKLIFPPQGPQGPQELKQKRNFKL